MTDWTRPTTEEHNMANLSAADLRRACRAHQLPTTGTKRHLASLLLDAGLTAQHVRAHHSYTATASRNPTTIEDPQRLVPNWFPTGSPDPIVDPKMTGSPGSPPRRGNQSHPLVPKPEGTSHQTHPHHTTTTNPQETPMTTPTDGHPIDQGPTPQPHRPDHVTLTAEELDKLTGWARSSAVRGGHRVWLEHDTTVAAAEEIIAGRLELLPAESMALTVGLAQTLRGEAPGGNVAAMCVLALARLTGRHDWTAEVEQTVPVRPPAQDLEDVDGDLADQEEIAAAVAEGRGYQGGGQS